MKVDPSPRPDDSPEFKVAKMIGDTFGFSPVFRLTLIFLGWTVVTLAAVEVEDRGFVVYRDNCMDCHLSRGMGIREMNAPSIAGLPRWYVTDQLREFRRGQRGEHDDDAAGQLMQIKAKSLGERDLAFVGRFIESMAPNPERVTLDAEITPRAEEHYLSDCAACHGDRGGGGRRERAPPLTRQPDWYLLKQMENFRTGRRSHGATFAWERTESGGVS
ncbi:MAG: c-type cytochrome [Verrucomicrobiia bacterium]